MKNVHLFWLLFLFLIGGVKAQEKPVLLPQPTAMKYDLSAKALSLQDCSIYLPAGASKDISFAMMGLKQVIEERLGKKVRIVSLPSLAKVSYSIKNKGLELPVVADTNHANQREAYSLYISSTSIKIEANTSAGLYYAIQTIRQLIQGQGKAAVLPAVTIKDNPVLPFRGVMMDFAHGGLLTVAEIKSQIDFLARYKANQYYFYNEVSIKMEGYPTLNYGANYTKEEIKSIIAYGKERHMDVIPFVAMYGHLHELIRNEKYASLAIGKYGHEIDPANLQVSVLMNDWIKQYTQLFESPFIHVGFDETWETKQISERAGQQKIDPEGLFIKQLTFISNELKQYGKTVLAWTDMNNFYPDILARFPKEVIPVIWEYTPDTAAINHYLRPVLKEKRPFFIQPAVSGWGHVYPNTNYTFDNINLCLEAGMANNTLGFITSVWTDPVEPFVRPSWLFMAYGCIGAWQGKVPDKNTFTSDYSSVEYASIGADMNQAISSIAASGEYLGKCLGKNTGGLPRGTIVESWSNPFQPYYLENTEVHLDDFIACRKLSEEAEGILISLQEKAPKSQRSFINSLLVSARLINYTATRFIWAKRICDRWKESTLPDKKDDFVIYDITYSCHGLLVDMMDECGELKSVYEKAWLDEYQPYRLNTMLARFDVEQGLWRKLFLKVLDHRIQLKDDEVSKSFEELFKPDF
ncbi:MAG: glycoside hydrolase [Ferruginibacter sp.]|uniref:family 20 glycosylhydrolase n=1 Tax=Ferruginibacter sp. TaxID=1940288 RepID=UPI0026589192|nr:family 20 glycosylhydrolase [Ferruginibacter sp.]MDB5275754.1 glycoside hydrolase [Ferruginibacter sp.]